MQTKRTLKRFLGLLQILCFTFLLALIIPQKVVASQDVGLGVIGFRENREIAPGVFFEHLTGFNTSGEQKAHTVVFASDKLTPVATFGQYLYGGETLSKMIELEEAKGSKVIAAINGDFYDTSNSVPIGSMIVNGRFVTSGNANSIGFKADGTAVHGRTDFSFKYNDGVKDVVINHINKDRKANNSSVFLYTRDFSESTRTTVPGTEVILTIDGELKVDQTVSAKVKEVRTNAVNTPIGVGEIVIGAHNDAASKISNLTVGTQINISVTDNKNAGWKDVVHSIGAGVTLVQNGTLPEGIIADKAIHPRTAIGIKEDGSYVLFQVDGRQPGYSNGLSYEEMYEFFVNEHNCIYAYNLDGGGSSTITVRLPGDQKASVQNIPSDGGERSNANGILFIAKQEADPTQEVAHLHSYPRNVIILEGGSVKLNVKATDKNFYPVPTPNDVTYTVNDGIGTIDENGNFTAKTGVGEGTITVRSGLITETVTVKIVDSIDKMTSDKTFVSVAPNGSMQININAYKDHMPITAGNSAFTWSLAPETLGTISNNGYFTGTSGSATGNIVVSYKSYSLEIPVEVGRPPKMISTFEDVVIGKDWIMHIENPGNGAIGSVSINEDERYVKFGHKSLRIDYDFRNATGTTGVTATLAGATGSDPNNYVQIEGYPTHIGMWVYGDNMGANIRMQLRDGTSGSGKVQYINFVPDTVNWTGWKYIEAEIPTGLVTPLRIQYPIRVMSVDGNVKSHGTLYFDNLRAVYGFKNDDVLNPQSGDPLPANNAVVTDKYQPISLKVWDDKSGVYTGINKESIKMWINDKLIENIKLIDNDDLSITISYTPSALTPYRPGPQNVKVRFEDNYGNIAFKNWTFTVEGDFVELDGRVEPNKDIIYSGESFEYIISANKYATFERLTGRIEFNGSALQISKVELFDNNLTLVKSDINQTTGVYEFDLQGMSEQENKLNPDLLKITFTTKKLFTGGADTAVIPKNINIYESGFIDGRVVQLPSFEKKVDYKYRLSYVTSTVGNPMVFTILDGQLNPISGVNLLVDGVDIAISELSDENGIIITDAFKNLPVNQKFMVTAVKDGLESKPIEVEILPSLGSSQPDMVIITPGENAGTSAVITWQTDLLTTDGEVMYRVKGSNDWVYVDSQLTKVIRVINSKEQTQEYLAHKVEIIGLAPNTEYEYRVGTEENYSEVKTFRTAKLDETIDILFLGDPQSADENGYHRTKALIDAAIKQKGSLDLGLIAGDLVEDVNYLSNWSALNNVLGSYFSKMMWSSASGNHDVIRSYGDPFNWAVSGPNNGVKGVLGVNYFFEYANIAIAVIDTETPSTFDAQKAWLLDKMNNTSAIFKFVLMHRNVYPSFNNDEHIRDWYLTFDEAEIDLVLSGHDHIYNRTSMKDNEKIAVGQGSVYISGGSAGPKFYNASNIDKRPWLDVLYDDDYNVYSVITVRKKYLKFEAYALVNGVSEQIDSFEINKSAPDRIEINAPEAVSVESSIRLEAKIFDESDFETSGNIKWSLLEEIAGVTLTENGRLTLARNVDLTKVIRVKATYLDLEQEAEIAITTEPAKIEVDAPEKVVKEYNESAVIDLLGRILDMYNNEITGTITWSLVDEVEGITVDQNGKVTVAKTFNDNLVIKIKATYENVEEIIEININTKALIFEDVLKDILDSHNQKTKSILG